MATYVLAGTYDGNLYGWELEDPARHVAEGAEVPMPLRIGTSAHIGSVKSIAVRKIKRGRVIVTGGEDENISCAQAGGLPPGARAPALCSHRRLPLSVFDLERLRQVGTLNQHRGSINCFDFFEGTHMLSGGDDAQVALWRTSDWECIHVLAGHKCGLRASGAAKSRLTLAAAPGTPGGTPQGASPLRGTAPEREARPEHQRRQHRPHVGPRAGKNRVHQEARAPRGPGCVGP